MTIQDILELPRNSIAPYGRQLAEAYWEIFNKRVCLSCYGDVNTMIYKLKKHYNMTQFELKRTNTIYRLEKGKPETISNDNMTDELAIRFIMLNPLRIELFSKYPNDWKTILGVETKQEDPVVPIKGESASEELKIASTEASEEDCGCGGQDNSEYEYDCRECLFKDLQPLLVKEIQELYPEVIYKVGTKKETYMEQIADYLNLQ